VKKSSYAIGALLLMLGASPVSAGVVITKKQTFGGVTPPRVVEQTVMIQGNKEKLIIERLVILIDLDARKQYFLDESSKSYSERDYPGKNPRTPAGAGRAVIGGEFAKDGTSRTIAGHKCDQYSGTTSNPLGELTITMCVSARAPGAAEVVEFERKHQEILKEAGIEYTASIPRGVPLQTTTSMKSAPPPMTDVPAQIAERARAMLAKRSPMDSSIEVIKIVAKKLAPEVFQVPAGYSRKSFAAPMAPPMPDLPSAPPRAIPEL